MRSYRVARVVRALERSGMLAGVHGTLPEFATDIHDDSRKVTRDSLFVAVRGCERDGHDFLTDAAMRGAAVAVVEDAARSTLPALVVRDGRRAAAVAAAAAFNEPASSLRLVAVTGTNGKTTTVGILRHLLDGGRGRSASLGTLGVLVGSRGEAIPGGAGLTTPGPIELQRVLRALVDRGIESVAMEVSSHSLEQRRVEGVLFQTAVFTNLTRDHLDYHGSMRAYFNAKARLVMQLVPDGAAVINADDAAWRDLPLPGRVVRFGLADEAEVRADAVRYLPRGSQWTLTLGGTTYEVSLPLIGAFNVANALGATAAASELGVPASEIAARLASAPQVPGRLELLHDEPAVLRDYAHTPDALERALAAVRPFAAGRLIVVFGCGGDRDPGKRPLMGAVAARGADLSILTSDNPRTEDPERILDQIQAGMAGATHERIEDRRAAIARALALAGRDDIILLAGKGHETYQIRGTTKLPFDERVVVRELIKDDARQCG